ncbi:hypothetical protein N9J42_00855 [bacterium]|nr:hypothetical protein [bacterium]
MPIKSSKTIIKGETNTPPSNELSKREIEFLLLKMKSAQFIGAEFEQFYAVFSKLTNQLKAK